MAKLSLGVLKKKRVWIPALIVVVIGVGVGGLWIYHENPNFCGRCHSMKSYVDSYQNPPLLANLHKQAEKNCLDCHPFTISQAWNDVVATVKNDYPQPLEQIEFTQQQCFECHGDWNEIKQETADMLSTVGQNPHDPPQDGIKEHVSEMECNTCHYVHKTSIEYCSQCHNPVMTEDGWTQW